MRGIGEGQQSLQLRCSWSCDWWRWEWSLSLSLNGRCGCRCGYCRLLRGLGAYFRLGKESEHDHGSDTIGLARRTTDRRQTLTLTWRLRRRRRRRDWRGCVRIVHWLISHRRRRGLIIEGLRGSRHILENYVGNVGHCNGRRRHRRGLRQGDWNVIWHRSRGVKGKIRNDSNGYGRQDRWLGWLWCVGVYEPFTGPR